MNLSIKRRVAVPVVGAAVSVLFAGMAAVGTASSAAATSTLTVAATSDTYTQYDQPDTAHGSSVRFSVQGDTNYWRHGFVRFPVVVPDGEEITNAKFRVTVDSGATGTGGVDLYKVAGGWSQTTLTWNTPEPDHGTWVGKKTVTAAGSVMEWDVTGILNNTTGSNQLNVKLETGDAGWYGFKSIESGTPPQLVLTTEPVSTSTTTTTPPPTTSSTTTPPPTTTTTTTPPPTTTTTTTPPPTTTTTTPPPSGDIVVAAVGDQNNTNNASTTSASAKVSNSIDSANPAFILGLGDFQYTYGSCANFVSYYDKLWGKHNSILYATAGPTHDFDATNSNSQNYSAYMSGNCSGQTGAKTPGAVLKGGTLKPTDYYSFNKGNWHFVQLPSGCYRYASSNICDNTAMLNWLETDLDNAQAAGKFIVGFWHEPYYTSATAEHSETEGDYTKPFVDKLSAHGARLVLNGHQHGYQRFYPMNNSGTRNDATGIQTFVVGTGGIGFYSFSSTAANTAVKNSDTHGWLKLTLKSDGSYTYSFVGVDGTFTDSGTRAAP